MESDTGWKTSSATVAGRGEGGIIAPKTQTHPTRWPFHASPPLTHSKSLTFALSANDITRPCREGREPWSGYALGVNLDIVLYNNGSM